MAVKLPQVIWADDAAIVKLALTERAATMNTDAAEGAHRAGEIADGIRVISHQYLGNGAGWEGGDFSHIDQRHRPIVSFIAPERAGCVSNDTKGRADGLDTIE